MEGQPCWPHICHSGWPGRGGVSRWGVEEGEETLGTLPHHPPAYASVLDTGSEGVGRGVR